MRQSLFSPKCSIFYSKDLAKGSLSKKILKDKAYEVARKEGSRIRSKCKLRTR